MASACGFGASKLTRRPRNDGDDLGRGAGTCEVCRRCNTENAVLLLSDSLAIVRASHDVTALLAKFVETSPQKEDRLVFCGWFHAEI